MQTNQRNHQLPKGWSQHIHRRHVCHVEKCLQINTEYQNWLEVFGVTEGWNDRLNTLKGS